MTVASDPVILGLGTALPDHVMTQDEAVFLAQNICCRTDDERRLVKVLYRKAGVQTRRTCVPHETALEWIAEAPSNLAGEHVSTHNGTATLEKTATVEEVEALPQHHGPTTSRRMQYYREHAPVLAQAASAAALAEANLPADAITHLVTVSCTGFYAPGVDGHLIETLGLRRTAERINVGFMGCHGAVNGLRVANALVRADSRNRVLVCAVELCSLHYCFEWDPGRAVGNAVFADGAAALVVAPGNAATSEGSLRASAVGSCMIPDSTDAITWDVGNHGFEMFLSPRVPDLINAHLRPWFEGWLAEQGLTIGEIGSWAIHPGGPRILQAAEESLGLERSVTATSRAVLAECGNMSSPTILFIVDRLRRANAPRPYVAMGFGPGLAAEVALFR